jgi:ring-1,2-phenylacetyl-CoA epoxidase subunit PaaE
MTDTTAPAASTPSRRHSVFHALRVAAIERLTDDAVSITFDVPQELREEFRFRPGQHISVRSPVVGDDVRRNYSICSPATGGVLRIGVKRIPEGVFSGFATRKLLVGDVLDVMTPTGGFTVDPDPTRQRAIGALAAGSGITPVLSILTSLLEAEPHSNATLIYLNKSTLNIMFLEELEDLKNRFPARFHLVHVLDEEPLDVEILSGRLDEARLRRIFAELVTATGMDAWYLCGPLPLTDLTRQVLLDEGVPESAIHRELFHVGTPAASAAVRAPVEVEDGTGSSVSVLLDGRTQSFVLAPDGPSILDATLRYRADAPYACKNAVCGTCRAKVTSGEVRMASNYALEPDEVAAGFVLTCQSHPVTEQVSLDFDA